MITARQKVLAHLKKANIASAREIARALKMSLPNVRHHLSVLCSDGRAENFAVSHRAGRGRPEKLFTLSRAATGDNLPVLADALLKEAGTKIKMEAVAGRVIDIRPFTGQAIQKRLPLLVEKLNGLHYQARWEAGAAGPRVLFGRCPYSKIIANHPELCVMDAALLEGSLARPVERKTRNEAVADGLCPFIFLVK